MANPNLTDSADEIQEKWDHTQRLQQRFVKLLEETNDERAQRLAREIAIDGDLAAIPAAHRLAVARQLIIALEEHDLIDFERDDAEAHWRVVARRLGLPYLEVFHAYWADRYRGDLTRTDLDEWLEWAREHAPERLQGPPKGGA